MDAWGYRWNEQMMASPGYVVVMVNPRFAWIRRKSEAEVSREGRKGIRGRHERSGCRDRKVSVY